MYIVNKHVPMCGHRKWAIDSDSGNIHFCGCQFIASWWWLINDKMGQCNAFPPFPSFCAVVLHIVYVCVCALCILLSALTTQFWILMKLRPAKNGTPAYTLAFVLISVFRPVHRRRRYIQKKSKQKPRKWRMGKKPIVCYNCGVQLYRNDHLIFIFSVYYSRSLHIFMQFVVLVCTELRLFFFFTNQPIFFKFLLILLHLDEWNYRWIRN